MIMKSDESTPVEVSRGVETGIGNGASQTGRHHAWAQAFILIALFAAPALLCLHSSVVADPDVWWHISSGQWIVQHGAFPHAEPFARDAAGEHWEAYSWLFEVLALRLYQGLGLTGFVVYSAAMVLAITAAFYRMINRLQGDFAIALLLSYAASLCLMNLWTPRSWMFTILFFVLEVDILMHARKTGKTGELYWLPLIFCLWANTHIQFAVGGVVLALAMAETVAGHWWSAIETRIPMVRMGIISVACLLATMVNPYGWRIYEVAHSLTSLHGILDQVGEFRAMSFRDMTEFGVLFFALAAAAVLARAKRLQVFEIVLLVFAVMISFRSQRDVWMLVTVASAIVAAGLKKNDANPLRVPGWAAPLVLIGAGLVLFAGFRLEHVDNDLLSAQLAGGYPVRAVEFIKQKGLPGPLYNDFNWGGYLIWDLRVPVTMDGRVSVYGEDRIARSIGTWGGAKDWASDAELQTANLVIGPVNQPLTQLLRTSPQFELAYEDKVAVVFVARGRKQP
jgi:hypothetical protein